MATFNSLKTLFAPASGLRPPGFFVAGLLLAMTGSAFAYSDVNDNDISAYDAAQKAREAHELANSDVIYQQADLKALYYQNIQMIDLLKDIRDSLQVIKARGGIKDTQEPSE